MSIVETKKFKNDLIFEATQLHDKIMADMMMLAKVDYTPNRVYLGEHNWRILVQIGLGISRKEEQIERRFLGLKVYIVKDDPNHMQVM